MLDRLLPLRALLRLLAVEDATLREWIAAGQFPAPVVLPGGQERWRASAVAAWQALLGTPPRGAAQLDDLPDQARDIITVLEESDADWMTGAEIHAKTGADGDHKSGHFRRCLDRLIEAGVVESNKKLGYRLAPSQEGTGALLVPSSEGTNRAPTGHQ